MLLQEVLSDKKPTHTPVNPQIIAEQLEAIVMTELWGGLGGLARGAAGAVASGAKAVGDKIADTGRAVADTYQQGEIKSLLQQFEKYKQQLVDMIQKNPRAFATEGETIDKDVLVELLGGMGALFGAAKNKAAAGMQAAGEKIKGAGQAVKGSYVKGEAVALLKKIVAVAKQLKEKGYKITPQQAQEYSKLRRMVGV